MDKNPVPCVRSRSRPGVSMPASPAIPFLPSRRAKLPFHSRAPMLGPDDGVAPHGESYDHQACRCRNPFRRRCHCLGRRAHLGDQRSDADQGAGQRIPVLWTALRPSLRHRRRPLRSPLWHRGRPLWPALWHGRWPLRAALWLGRRTLRPCDHRRPPFQPGRMNPG